MCYNIRVVKNFNPLPRKEGDRFPMPIAFFKTYISIHSLVKRETVLQ